MSSTSSSGFVKPVFPYPDLEQNGLKPEDAAKVLLSYYDSLDRYNLAVADKEVDISVLESLTSRMKVPSFTLSRAATRRVVANSSARLKHTGEVVNLQKERPKPSYGYCYLSLISVDWVGVAAAHLGFAPVMSRLLECPAQWFRDRVSLMSLYAQYTEPGCVHVSTSGTIPVLEAMAFLSRRARHWPRASFARRLIDSFPEGCGDGGFQLLDVVGKSRVESVEEEEELVVLDEAVVEPQPCDDGYCYVKALAASDVSSVVARLGPEPSVFSLLDVPRRSFVDGRALRALKVVWVSSLVCHVTHLSQCGESFVGVLQEAASTFIGPFQDGAIGLQCRAGVKRSGFPVHAGVVCGSLGLCDETDGEFAWVTEFASEYPGVDPFRLRYVVAYCGQEQYEPARVVRRSRSRGTDELVYSGSFPRNAFAVFPPGVSFDKFKAIAGYTVVRLCDGVNFRCSLGKEVQVRQPHFWRTPSHAGFVEASRLASDERCLFLEREMVPFNAVPFGSQVFPEIRKDEMRGDGVQRTEYSVESSAGPSSWFWVDFDAACGTVSRVEASSSVVVRFGSMKFRVEGFVDVSACFSTSRRKLLVRVDGAISKLVLTSYSVVDHLLFDRGGLSYDRSQFSGYSQF